jgi:putative transposase
MPERAFKTKIILNNTERTYFQHCCDVARFVYNWALNDRKIAYETDGTAIGCNDQKVRFNALKKVAFPWLLDTPYVITEYAFRDLDTAYKNFFRRVRQGTEAPGFPKFKSRHDSKQSFSVRGSVTVEDGRIKLPVIGWVRLMEYGYIPTGKPDGRVTVSVHAGEWWVSVQMDAPAKPQPARTDEVIGVDLGHGVLATLSDGTQYQNPRVLEQAEKKLARLQRELSRREKGSANREKTKQKIAKLHAKIARIRAHGLHDTSRKIVDKRAGTIALEGYHVRDMMEQTPQKERKYARRNFKMADASVGELRRQITYKQEWAGGEIYKADRDEPTNRQHCACGYVNEVVPLIEQFICAGCGATVQRRLNSADNVVRLATS